MTTAYHPQTNGLTERFNKTLTDMMSMYVDVEQKDWDLVLPFVTFAYNTAKQDVTGFTPFFLLHGREAETTMDTLFPYQSDDQTDDYLEHFVTTAEESRQLARLWTLMAQQKDRGRYDTTHRTVSYQPGDLVWIITPILKVGLSEKLLKRYFGPYKVLKRLSDVTYEVEDFDPMSERRKVKDIVHVLRMKPYCDSDNQDVHTTSNDDPHRPGTEPAESAMPEIKPSETSKTTHTGPLTRSRTRDKQALEQQRGALF
jgi:hypothetical protein